MTLGMNILPLEATSSYSSKCPTINNTKANILNKQ